MTVEVRPPRRDEAEAIVEAYNAATQSLYGTAETSLDDLVLWFDSPSLDTERDAVVALLPDGRVGAYADITDVSQKHADYHTDLRFRPGREELAGRLLDAMERRARETALDSAELRGFADARDEAARRVFESRGYAPVRHSFRMLIDLDPPPPPPEWPDGIAVREFRPGEEDERVYEVHMEAFADMWAFTRSPYEEWRFWMMREPFDPTLWFLACDGEEIAGFCLAGRTRSAIPASAGSHRSALAVHGAAEGSASRSFVMPSRSSAAAGSARSGSAWTRRA